MEELTQLIQNLWSENKLSKDAYAELLNFTNTHNDLQLYKTQVSGSDILEVINESTQLIDYMHQLTVIPDNLMEDYDNRFANTMSLLATLRSHYR